jgi:hypothetical protein
MHVRVGTVSVKPRLFPNRNGTASRDCPYTVAADFTLNHTPEFDGWPGAKIQRDCGNVYYAGVDHISFSSANEMKQPLYFSRTDSAND